MPYFEVLHISSVSVAELPMSKPNMLTLRKAARVAVRQISWDTVLKLDLAETIFGRTKPIKCTVRVNIEMSSLLPMFCNGPISQTPWQNISTTDCWRFIKEKLWDNECSSYEFLWHLQRVRFEMASAMAAAAGLSEDLLERLAGDPLSCVERVSRYKNV